jgi:1-acyl-sn-glycerol-3-phosphate acyltransferase
VLVTPAIRSSPRYPVERWLMLLLIRIFLRGGLRVEGLENIPKGGCLVACNHIATCDPPVVGALIPRHDVHYMAKAELFAKPWVRWLADGYNAFPVIRHTADRPAIRRALGVLAQGHVLIMMPEGTRSPDARMRRGEPGVGLLARRSGAPIVPVGVWGSENALPKGARMPRHAEVHVRFGPAVHLPDRPMSNQERADWIMERIAELVPDRYRGVYADEAGALAASAP